MKEEIINENEIRVLGFPEAIRTRPGMYVGGVDDTTQLLTELIGNIQDEISACKTCNDALIDQNWNGYQLCCDSGRGMPIILSKDIPNKTSMEVAVTNMHAGSKFSSTDNLRVGFNGCGLKAVNALSERFIIMSKVTQDNYNKSIPVVETAWNSCGPRLKKNLYYILVFEKGYKIFEGVDLIDNLEIKIFSDTPGFKPLPRNFSTIVLFKGDPEIYENINSKLPIKFLQYFLLIQEKIYKRKLNIIVNGESLSGTFKPFKFEILKTIIPADTSKNRYVTVYVTFEADEELGQKQLTGSALGLSCDQGVHINYIESCFEQALINEYKIKHKFTTQGLKMCVIIIAEDLIFNSQTKERLKSISKVKQTDFNDITKEFQKIFRGNPEYWEGHVSRLNYLAESMRSLSAAEKAQKMIEEAQGRNMFKSKAELIPGFSDATEIKDRWKCECFLCEGLSPAGSLKSGRHGTQYHAVLPLRGKILNVEGKSMDQALDNKEIFTIFKVIGLGIGDNNVTSDCNSPEEAYEKIKKFSRFGKIIIATDADPDGSAIAKLLLYLFGKFGKFLIDFGMIYRIDSPIYEQDGKKFYPEDPIQPGTTFPIGLDPSKPFHRYKGLGAFNKDQIYDIFYNPLTRKLIQVTPEGFEYSMRLSEDINERKKLLYDSGILSNPYGFTDI